MKVWHALHKLIVTAFAGFCVAVVTAAASLAGPAEDGAQLDKLFAALKDANPADARVIESDIWRLWSRSGSPAMDLLLERGEKATEQGDYERAIAYASAAYAIAMSNPALASSYGWMLYKSGKDKSGGIALLKKSVAIAPNAPMLRFQLAQLMIESGNRDEARTQLQAAIAMPDFAERKAAQDLLKRI